MSQKLIASGKTERECQLNISLDGMVLSQIVMLMPGDVYEVYIIKSGEKRLDWAEAITRLGILQHYIKECEVAINYPDKWDTTVYPTFLDALAQLIACHKMVESEKLAFSKLLKFYGIAQP